MLDAIDGGLIVCLDDGELVFANRAAQRELKAGATLCLVDGRLRCANSGSELLMNALADAATHQRRRLFAVGGAGRGLTLATAPVEADPCADPQAGDRDQHRPLVLVLLGRRRLCSALALQMLSLRHGLTSAEERVLGELIESRSARQIAELNKVQVSTVRTQIQSIRDKFGVRTVDALLVKLATAPALGSR